MASSSIQSIFISYSREDVAGARELREWLLTHGRQPWMDLFDIPAGARWPDEIDAALRSSDATIGLMSPSSLASENVKNEWDWAIANNRRLILLLVEPCDVPFHYVSRNYIDFTGDREAGYRALDAALVRKPAQAQPDSVDTTANARGDAPARTSHAFTSPGTGTRLRRAMSRRRSVSLLVGRDREQRRLTDILDSAVCGSGGLVLLGGEAGIGKTTLTRWLQAQAEQQGALVLSGGCYDLATTPPYGPWVEILRVYQPEGGLPPIPAQIRDDAGLASIPSRAALFEIVGEFFAEVSEHRPLVLVLEDLHWADQATLDLLRFFARFLPGLPSLTVATYRDDELTRRHPLSELLPLLAREDGASRLTLRRLDLAETRSLLRERYQLPEHEEDQLVTHLQQLSEGNPFFASEVLNTLEEQSVLRRTDDGWQLSELSDIAVPPLLRQVIEGRLQRLDPDTRTPLEIAAIIGQDVPIDLWQQVSGLASDEVSAAMTEAIDANLLEESADGMSLTFRHALIREALYAGVAPLQRRDRHRAVAEALFDEPHPDPDAVLTHLEHAHDPRALEWLARAGDRAMSRFAWDVAIERYGRALELIERQSQPDARQHCEILLALGEAQNQVAAGRPTAGSHLVLGAGGSYAGRDTFWRAAGIARSAGLPEHLARAALGVVGFNPHPQQGGPEGIDLLEEALAHLPTGDSDLRVRLLARLGTDPYIQAAYHGTRPLTTELAEQLRQRSDEAVAMARRLGNPAALGYALAMRGLRP
ncbi:MAG TPA: AAA family ATPase, partial [Thermomicrobiales bacterium]|nr:AAA family ATPase [Thermomicrobiales bacterium]